MQTQSEIIVFSELESWNFHNRWYLHFLFFYMPIFDVGIIIVAVYDLVNS